MSVDSEMVALFRAELELCKVRPGETVAVLSEAGIRADYAAGFMAAAQDMGASSFHLSLLKRARPGYANSLGGNQKAIDALKGVDMIIDLMALLWSPEQKEILAEGPRMLLVLEPLEVLRRMLPSENARQRVEAGGQLLKAAKELRVTSEAGTDVTYRLGKYPVVLQYGYTDIPGRWDAWPGAFLYTAGADDGVDGTVVIDTGDMFLMPFMKYASSPITLTIERGYIRDIGGRGLEAALWRNYLSRWNDPRAYAISHIGWGLDDKAVWDFMGTRAGGQTVGQDGRAYNGGVLFSTGPNTELGGTNDTHCHMDIPLRNCSLYLDGKVVVERGQVVPKEMRPAGR